MQGELIATERHTTKINLIGRTFNRLTVLSEAGKNKRGSLLWECICICGKKKIVEGSSLRYNRIQSCGCLNSELRKVNRLTHGHTKNGRETPEYSVWLGVIKRCYNENSKHYQYYGGRGIKVCPEWHNPEKFITDMGPRPTSHHSIDRINNDGGYEPSNCRWATATTQGNNKRNNIKLTYQGKTLTIAQWSRYLGLSYFTIIGRHKRGFSIEKILSTESHKTKKQLVKTKKVGN